HYQRARFEIILSLLVSKDLSVFHHENDLFYIRNIAKRIARNGDYIGEFSLFDFPDLFFQTEKLSRLDGCRADCFFRSHSALDHPDELSGIVPVKPGDGV